MGNRAEDGTDGDEVKAFQRPTVTDRRTFLSRFSGAASIMGITGVAGCTSLLGRDPLTIGYEPSFRTLQVPIMVQKGYLDELDTSIEVNNYGELDGTLEGNYADGTVEVGFEETSSVILRHAMSRAHSKILAANNQNDCAFLASEAFAETWTDHDPEAFARFREQNGDPFVLGASEVQRASLWLDAIGVSDESVELSLEANSRSIRTQIQNGLLDGVFQPEPMLTKLAHADVGMVEVAWTGSTFSNLPGGVMVVRDEFRKDSPELVNAILEKHIKATEVLNERPGEAASIVSDAFGDELSTSLAKAALEKKTADFITDPRAIIEETNALAKVTAESVGSAESVSAEEIIDPSSYVEVA